MMNDGLITPEEFLNFFNSICRKYRVPFVIFTQNDKCYVVHTTDVFVEKIIQELPCFLTNPDLKPANDYFIKAYKERDEGNFPESLNNIRKGIKDFTI